MFIIPCTKLIVENGFVVSEPSSCDLDVMITLNFKKDKADLYK